MGKKRRFACIALVTLWVVCTGATTRRDNSYDGRLGLRIPAVGLTIDALYDPRLDTLVPGYRILNIVLVNDSGQKLFFHPKKDRWKIQDALGKSRMAITSLADERRSVWKKLKPELQKQLAYPLAVHSGEKVMFSIFFKGDTELREFRSLVFYSPYLKKILRYHSEGIPFEEKTEEDGE